MVKSYLCFIPADEKNRFKEIVRIFRRSLSELTGNSLPNRKMLDEFCKAIGYTSFGDASRIGKGYINQKRPIDSILKSHIESIVTYLSSTLQLDQKTLEDCLIEAIDAGIKNYSPTRFLDFYTDHGDQEYEYVILPIHSAMIEEDVDRFSELIKKLPLHTITSSKQKEQLVWWASKRGLNQDLMFLLNMLSLSKDKLKMLIPPASELAPPSTYAILCEASGSINEADNNGKTCIHHLIDKQEFSLVIHHVKEHKVTNPGSYLSYAVQGNYGPHIK